MPFKRPAPPRQASSGYSSKSEPSTPDVESPSKRSRVGKSNKLLPDVKLYIVQAKIDGPSLVELFKLAERHCESLVGNAEDSDVIITAISMRRRFERHVSWEVAKIKAIVTPAWLRDSVAEGKALPCEGYIAVQDLRDETIKNCPGCDKTSCECEDTDMSETGLESDYPSPPRSSASALLSTLPPEGVRGQKAELKYLPPESSLQSLKAAGESSPPRATNSLPEHLLPPSPPVPTNLALLTNNSNYACQRASPMVCPNQALAAELDIIKRSRALEGEDRSALSYSRAISVIKAHPYRITSTHQVSELPHIGTKISGLIQEFIDRGRIGEAQTISASERFDALTTFSTVYGIGPQTARRLYALGLRTVDDLEAYYGVDSEGEEGELVEFEHQENFGKDREAGLGDAWIKIALDLRKDLEMKIPRDEVEEMGRVVMDELNYIEPGCVSTIVGGYRRGKRESNDVDIVFTHPDPAKTKGLCKRFVKHLHSRGMVTHVMHLSGFHGHNPLRTTHWDSLEKALTVFILPPSSSFHKGTRRRLDLIFAQPEVYWCAVIGWSGSPMFQRDLRQWAKDKKGMKFDSSGITRRYDSRPFYPKTEKDVFDVFGLEWVDPTWRNADL